MTDRSQNSDVSPRFFGDVWKIFILSLVLLAVAALFGIAERHGLASLFGWPPAEHHQLPALLSFVGDVIKELGVAGIISVAIIETIERLSRDRQSEEVSRLIDKVKTNVLEAVYGTAIANIFFEPFRRVIDNPVMRLDGHYRADIRFWDRAKESVSDDDVVLIDVIFSFELLNCSTKPYVHKNVTRLSNTWPALAKMGIPRHGDVHLKVKRAADAQFEPVTVTKTDESLPDTEGSEYEVAIDAGERVSLIVSYRLVQYARDASSLFSSIPTDRMRFDLHFDPRLTLYHTNVHELDFIDETPEYEEGRRLLSSAGPLFPDNGILFWWRPSDQVGAGESSRPSTNASVAGAPLSP